MDHNRREFLSLAAAFGAAMAMPVPEDTDTREEDWIWEVNGKPFEVHYVRVGFAVDDVGRSAIFKMPTGTNMFLPAFPAATDGQLHERIGQLAEAAETIEGLDYLYLVRVDCPSQTWFHAAALPHKGLTLKDMFWTVPSNLVKGLVS